MTRILATVARLLIGALALPGAAACAEAAPTKAGGLKFPLELKIKWTYHLHQENSEGVNFSEEIAKLAKGKVLDITVTSTVVGRDKLGGSDYFRIDSLRGGKLWLSEWYRSGGDGVFLGKTIDSETGETAETVMTPPQKVLSANLRNGESWSWKAADAPVTVGSRVVGPATIEVPAGRFDATQIAYDWKIQLDGGMSINIRQERWFAPGVGFVKQDTRTLQGGRPLSHVILTLEKFEPVR